MAKQLTPLRNSCCRRAKNALRLGALEARTIGIRGLEIDNYVAPKCSARNLSGSLVPTMRRHLNITWHHRLCRAIKWHLFREYA